MNVPNENYVKDFVTRNIVFIIQLIILFTLFIYRNLSIVSTCANFWPNVQYPLCHLFFPKAWPFSEVVGKLRNGVFTNKECKYSLRSVSNFLHVRTVYFIGLPVPKSKC